MISEIFELFQISQQFGKLHEKFEFRDFLIARYITTLLVEILIITTEMLVSEIPYKNHSKLVIAITYSHS